jgi:hypothetical protein
MIWLARATHSVYTMCYTLEEAFPMKKIKATPAHAGRLSLARSYQAPLAFCQFG